MERFLQILAIEISRMSITSIIFRIHKKRYCVLIESVFEKFYQISINNNAIN